MGAETSDYLGVANSDYQPTVPIEAPAVFAWPPRPGAAIASAPQDTGTLRRFHDLSIIINQSKLI